MKELQCWKSLVVLCVCVQVWKHECRGQRSRTGMVRNRFPSYFLMKTVCYIYLFVYMYVWEVQKCYMVVRGQLEGGIASSLYHVRLGDQIRSSGLVTSSFTRSAILPGLPCVLRQALSLNQELPTLAILARPRPRSLAYSLLLTT